MNERIAHSEPRRRPGRPRVERPAAVVREIVDRTMRGDYCKEIAYDLGIPVYVVWKERKRNGVAGRRWRQNR